MNPYYKDDMLTLYNGECLSVLMSMESESVDMVLTDPPFPNGAGTFDRYVVYGYAALIESMRIARKAIVFFWSQFNEPKPQAPWHHTATHVWEKPNGRSSRWYENIYVWERTPEWRSCRIWRVPAINSTVAASMSHDEYLKHPNQKPLKIIEKILDWYPGKVESIIDPFSGSGSVLKVAKRRGLEAIGIEIDNAFCEMSAGRFQNMLPLVVRSANKALLRTQARSPQLSFY